MASRRTPLAWIALATIGLAQTACPLLPWTTENCLSEAATVCDDGMVYWVDSCGEREGKREKCTCGCNAGNTDCGVCACTPDCSGKVCGDDGCGGTCSPSCGTLESCVGGSCDCSYASCGGSCCQQGQACHSGSCCTPSCGGRECGPDGCGGSCAPGCTDGFCDETGHCQEMPEDCREDPCPGGYYCDLGSGDCLEGCINAGDCPQPGSCDPISHDCYCNPATHLCGDVCLSDYSPASCGSACSPCQPPAHATATCDGASCGHTCNSNYHDCSGSCVSNSSVDHCGASCSPCQPPANGTATCNGMSCGFSCNSGYHICDGGCVADNSVDHCGSSCSPCDPPWDATATCDGTSCGFTCDAGYHRCGDYCESDDDPDSCGSTCTPCPDHDNAYATCDGVSCGFACWSGYHLCGQDCVDDDVVDHCGASCTPCPADPHGTATCDGETCDITCQDDYLLCEGACAACPTSEGKPVFGCDGASCVVASCEEGWMCEQGCCNWDHEVIDTKRGNYPSIVVDATGVVHLAYYAPGFGVYYAHGSTGDWQIELVSTSVCDGATSIAVDDLGQAQIACNGNSYTIRYFHFDGSHWLEESPYTNSYGYGPHITTQSLVIDSSGVAHLAIGSQVGSPRGFQIVFATRSGGSWDYRSHSYTGGVEGPVMAVDNSDVLHAAWVEVDSDALYYATGSALAMTPTQVSSDASCCDPPSLMLDGQWTPHIAFLSRPNNDLVHVYPFEETWPVETLYPEVGILGQVAMDGGERFHWTHGISNRTYARPEGPDSWSHVTLLRNAWCKMAVDPIDDTAHFVCGTINNVNYIDGGQ